MDPSSNVRPESGNLISRFPLQRDHSQQSTPRVFWLLYGDRATGSSRLHGYYLNQYLQSRGWNSQILLEPLTPIMDVPIPARDLRDARLFRPNDVVIFQKLTGKNTLANLEWLADSGAKTVYIDSDMPLKLGEASLASWVVCVSAFQAHEYQRAGVKQVVYIPDIVEAFKAPKMDKSPSVKLRCVWFGSWTPAKAADVEYFRNLLRENLFDDVELITISDHPDATFRWELATVFEHLHDCDFAVIPLSVIDATASAKSSNRAIQAMALGLPVIASPIPAYEEVIHSGWNGFLCRTDAEWIAALNQMRDATRRHEFAQNAYRLSQTFFSVESIGALWEDFLTGIVAVPDKSTARRDTWQGLHQRQLRARVSAHLMNSTGDLSLVAKYFLRSLRECPLDMALLRESAHVFSRAKRKLSAAVHVKDET